MAIKEQKIKRANIGNQILQEEWSAQNFGHKVLGSRNSARVTNICRSEAETVSGEEVYAIRAIQNCLENFCGSELAAAYFKKFDLKTDAGRKFAAAFFLYRLGSNPEFKEIVDEIIKRKKSEEGINII